MLGIDFIPLIKQLSYFGFFLVGLISSSTLFIPFPIYSILIFSGSMGLNPIIAAIFTAAGSTLGEIIGFLVGRGSSNLFLKKEGKKYKKYVNFFKKFGGIAIFLFAALPLPFDIIGIISGFLKYDMKKFLLFTFLGKLIKMLIVAISGEIVLHYILEW